MQLIHDFKYFSLALLSDLIMKRRFCIQTVLEKAILILK